MSRKFLFIFSFMFPLFLYRLVVVLREGQVSWLRGVTGYQVHHYHYGVLLVTIGVILLLFYEVNKFSVVVSGFGLGALLDGFISSLFASSSRVEEIVNYTGNFVPTVVLFSGVVLLVTLVSRINRTP
jgi:hypothetical protein